MYSIDDYASDTLDMLADEHIALEEEMEEARILSVLSEREEQAYLYGIPISMIKPTDAIFQIVQWIIKFGTIKKATKIAGGIMTTKQEVIDLGHYGKFYLKTGWYTKDGVSCHTMTPDEFILELVSKEVADGKVI